MATIERVSTEPSIQFRMALGAVVKSARLRAELTQDDLALRAGIDRKSVSRLETGTYSPSLDRFMLVASALGVHASDLVAAAEVSLDRS